MKEKIAKLIDLKSIITILITSGILYGFIVNKITPEQFMTLATMIFTFYFTKEWKYQCFDLVQKYITECLGLPSYIMAGCKNVCNMLYGDKEKLLLTFFDEISVYEMTSGDICFWYNNHTAIFDHWDGSKNWFFSQNPNPSKVMAINMGKFRAFRKKTNEEIIDQILHKGSRVQIPGTFEVIDINVKDNTALVRIDGKDYWLSSIPLLEVK